jgi:hypothetical protein
MSIFFCGFGAGFFAGAGTAWGATGVCVCVCDDAREAFEDITTSATRCSTSIHGLLVDFNPTSGNPGNAFTRSSPINYLADWQLSTKNRPAVGTLPGGCLCQALRFSAHAPP